MGVSTDNVPSKTDAFHVEKISTSSLEGAGGPSQEPLEDLDSIESTKTGHYAWLVATTAGVSQTHNSCRWKIC